MSYKSGIYRHDGIVHPESIDISSNRIVAYAEPGYMDLPDDKRYKMQLTFLRCCLRTETDPRMAKYIEEQIEDLEIESSKGIRKVIKKVMKKRKNKTSDC